MTSQNPPSAATKKEFRPVKSAERVMDILEIIGASDSGVSFVQLGQQLGIPKSSLFALIETMEARGYLLLNPETRKYALGLRTWEIGQAFQRNNSVLDYASTVLDGIVKEVNETAQLARLDGEECIYLAKKDSSHALRLQSDIGIRLKAHATGVGKAILAKLDDSEITALYADEDLPVYTPQSLNSIPKLLAELSLTRTRGFAVDNEEYTPGVFCLAVPVIEASGAVTMGLSVTVPITRSTPESLARILTVIAHGSCDFSTRMGKAPADPMLLKLTDIDAATCAINELIRSDRYNLNFR